MYSTIWLILCDLFDYPTWIAHSDHIIGNVFCDHATRANNTRRYAGVEPICLPLKERMILQRKAIYKFVYPR